MIGKFCQYNGRTNMFVKAYSRVTSIAAKSWLINAVW